MPVRGDHRTAHPGKPVRDGDSVGVCESTQEWRIKDQVALDQEKGFV